MKARLSPHGNIFISRHGKTFAIEREEAESLLRDLTGVVDKLKKNEPQTTKQA